MSIHPPPARPCVMRTVVGGDPVMGRPVQCAAVARPRAAHALLMPLAPASAAPPAHGARAWRPWQRHAVQQRQRRRQQRASFTALAAAGCVDGAAAKSGCCLGCEGTCCTARSPTSYELTRSCVASPFWGLCSRACLPACLQRRGRGRPAAVRGGAKPTGAAGSLAPGRRRRQLRPVEPQRQRRDPVPVRHWCPGPVGGGQRATDTALSVKHTTTRPSDAGCSNHLFPVGVDPST